MAAYTKLNFKMFKVALEQGKYEIASSARRAVGKASDITASEKDQARKLIDARFGTDAPKAVAKPAVKAAPVKAAKAAKAAAVKPVKVAKAVKMKTAKAAAKLHPVVDRDPVTAAPAPVLSDGVNYEDVRSTATQIKLAEKASINAAASINALVGAKQVGVDIDEGAVQNFTATLDEANSIFRSIVTRVAAVLATPVRATRKTRTVVEEETVTLHEDPTDESPSNGAGTLTGAEMLYQASSPTAS